MSNNEAIANIDKQATIEANQSGGTHVFARFNRFTVGTEVVVLPEGDFEWNSPREENYVDKLVFAKLKELRITRSDVLFDYISQAPEYKHPFRRSTADRAAVMFEGGRRDNFFSTFGQAKRESVCTCETQANASLSQALHLINGRTIDDTFRRRPVLIPRLMKEHDQPEALIQTLYVRILSRHPSEKELASMLKLVPESSNSADKAKFYSSVAWALVNSNEFLFNH